VWLIKEKITLAYWSKVIKPPIAVSASDGNGGGKNNQPIAYRGGVHSPTHSVLMFAASRKIFRTELLGFLEC
jgi:hypothetical protein